MIRYAWRGLWARKTRTALTLVGVAVCVLALATVDGMLGHMQAERVQDVNRFAGRLMLQSPAAGYPPFTGVLRQESIAATLDRLDISASESTPLLLLVLAPADNPMDVAGVIGLGLWPGREQAWLSSVQATSGRPILSQEGNNVVILGSQAARFYGVSVSGEVITLAQRGWRVAGILQETGMTNIDNLVVMPLASAQTTFGLEGWISAVLLTAKEGQADALARSLAEAYPALEVTTQADIRRALFKQMELPGKFLGTLSATAFLIAVLIVANIMNIAVRERTQEVELMRAIGAKRPAILAYTLAEALILSLSGGALGLAAAVPTAYTFDWTWILSWGEPLRVVALAVTAGLLAGVYPAYRATHAYPQALRYEELRRQMEEVAAEKRAMDQAYRHLVRGREEERERLGRELHDEGIQSLVGLKFHLAEKVPDAPTELQDEINEVIERLRGLCADLRPPALDRLGLAAVLRSYVDNFSARTGLPVELHVEGDERRLSADVELTLFRVAQEALTNAWKHAQASTVETDLRFSSEAVELTVRDHGRGFVVPERLGALAEAGHLGLVSMRERLELIGATLTLKSEPGLGTTVTAQVPVR